MSGVQLSCNTDQTFMGFTYHRQRYFGENVNKLPIHIEKKEPATTPFRYILGLTQRRSWSCVHSNAVKLGRKCGPCLLPVCVSHKYQQTRKSTARGSPCNSQSSTLYQSSSSPHRRKLPNHNIFPVDYLSCQRVQLEAAHVTANQVRSTKVVAVLTEGNFPTITSSL